jgi:hypothetical protein
MDNEPFWGVGPLHQHAGPALSKIRENLDEILVAVEKLR